MRNPVLRCRGRRRCAARRASAAGSLSVPIDDFRVLHRRWRCAFACRQDRDNINADDKLWTSLLRSVHGGIQMQQSMPSQRDGGRDLPLHRVACCIDSGTPLVRATAGHTSSSRQDTRQMTVGKDCTITALGQGQGFNKSAAYTLVRPVIVESLGGGTTHQPPLWKMPALWHGHRSQLRQSPLLCRPPQRSPAASPAANMRLVGPWH